MKHSSIRIVALAIIAMVSTTVLSGCSLGSFIAANRANENTATSTVSTETEETYSTTSAAQSEEESESEEESAPTSTKSSSSDELAVDDTPYSEEELTQAAELATDFTNAFNSGDYASMCRITTDTSMTPPYVIETDREEERCADAAASQGTGDALSEDRIPSGALEAKDIGDGFAEIYYDDIFTDIIVVKLTNGKFYVDIADHT